MECNMLDSPVCQIDSILHEVDIINEEHQKKSLEENIAMHNSGELWNVIFTNGTKKNILRLLADEHAETVHGLDWHVKHLSKVVTKIRSKS